MTDAARIDLARRLVLSVGHGHLAACASRPASPEALEIDAERRMRLAIEAAFPGDAVLGEELGGSMGWDGGGDADVDGDGDGDGKPGVMTWLIDPLDGTANFARLLPHWTVTLALIRHGRPIAAFVHHPPSGELFEARRREGAFVDGRRLEIAAAPAARTRIVDIGWEAGRDVDRHAAASRLLLRAGASPIGINASGLGLAWVAAGRIDAVIDAATQLWDACAGLLLVREAGGFTHPAPVGLRGGQAFPVLACAPDTRGLVQPAFDMLRGPGGRG